MSRLLSSLLLLLVLAPAAAPAQTKTHRYTPTEGVPTFAARPPVLRVAPGDIVETETFSRPDDYYARPGGRWPGEVGPFHVDGVGPGDTLVVKLLKLRLNRDTAVSAVNPGGISAVAADSRTRMLNDPLPPRRYEWRLDRARNVGVLDLPESASRRIEIPLQPMLGRVAVAPAGEESWGGLWPGNFGGNMDAPDIREGVTVYLPVFHEGALFYFGDVHAAQGDGEIVGSGLETTADVTFQFDVIKGQRLAWPRIEDDTHLMVAGSARPLVDAFRIAHVELIDWLVADYGFDRMDAYQVLSQAGTARVANVVDPNYTVVAKFPKALLPQKVAAGSAQRHPLAIPATDDGLPGAGPIRRYDWFQSLWLERRTQWAARREQDRGAVVFLGDSITQGWNERLAAAFPGMQVANRGISGDTTRGVLIRLREDVLSLQPKAVVLLIGTNDIEEGATPDVIEGNVRLILDALRAHDPQMPVVLCDLLPSDVSMRRPAESIREVNARLQALAKGHAQIVPLDTYRLYATRDGNAPKDEFPDLLHLNDAGYARWAAALRPVLATLGFLEAEPDAFVPEPGFTSLFNGRDLTGWGYRRTSDADRESARRWQASSPNAALWPFVDEPVNFDGLAQSPDDRFRAIAGRLVVTPAPEGRKIQQLWTTREFGDDFELRLEFRATPNADSGLYLRGPQLQVRDYRLAGPYRSLSGYRPQDWNELVVVVRGQTARVTCNGELLEEAFEVPASGPIGLEGDRGQMEYRRIRIRPLTP